jgi:alanyl-tRNA synthetase
MLDSSKIRTRKLYYEDAYRTEFTAKVVSANAGDVVLDSTAFFPEEGGQSADTGMLGGFRVADVKIKDGEIHHLLEDKSVSFEEGTEVSGRIDWPHRFSNMQQHSGEHIFSGLVHTEFGFDNVGFHLSDREVTMDFNGVFPEGGLALIERRANKAIWSNIETQIAFLEGAEAREAEYRSKLELTGAVRVVTFPGIDACACCAPHVRRSGEIGCLVVVGAINYKGGTRVSILCGGRAMQLFAHEHMLLTRTANFLTTSADNVPESTMRLKNENTALKAALKNASIAAMEMKAAALPAGDHDACLFEKNELSGKVMQETVNRMTEKISGYCGIFCGNDEEGYKFVVGSREKDAREMAKILREQFGARGGGKPLMVQGSVHAEEDKIRALFV